MVSQTTGDADEKAEEGDGKISVDIGAPAPEKLLFRLMQANLPLPAPPNPLPAFLLQLIPK